MTEKADGFSIVNTFLNFAELGAEWVMWLMLGLGFVLVVIVLERLRLYLTTRVDAARLARELVGHLEKGDVVAARKLFEGGRAMEERVLSDALEAYGRGALVVEQVMQSSIAREKQRFDRFLNYVGTLGNNAPFIGLFGTVIGIIVSFKQLGANPKGGLEIVGPGIAEALVATAVGLLVAIPAVVCFNSFKSMLKTRLGNTDFLGRILLAQINHTSEKK